jgi:hypothetical protein
LSRFRSVSTVFATVVVKNASCFGSSSERDIRPSNVPACGEWVQVICVVGDEADLEGWDCKLGDGI